MTSPPHPKQFYFKVPPLPRRCDSEHNNAAFCLTHDLFRKSVSIFRIKLQASPAAFLPSAAWAAASRAIGTRNGEHET